MSREAVNKKTYSTARAVEVYSRDYLRPYERFLIEHYLKPTDCVLTIGCGTGRSMQYLTEKTSHVIGIDMVENFIAKGKELHPQFDLRVMNAVSLDFPTHSFDVVFFPNQGIDYTERREKVLQEARRVLKPGGLFVYTSHNSLMVPRTRRTARDFIKNIPSWRPWRHVRVEYQPNGELHVAYVNVWEEQAFIRTNGFDLVGILANKYPNARQALWRTGFFERWPMYIMRKPRA